ncbi:MAG: hypothetical protein WB615_05295 [Candidatus Tumulicola sp.]
MCVPLVPNLLAIETTDDLFWYRPRLAATAFDGDVLDDAIAIRYLTQSKFERFVRSSAVHLRRHDLLREIDAKEGAVAALNLALDAVVAAKYGNLDAKQRELQRQVYEEVWLAQAFVACFNLDGDESPAMYDKYIRDDNGVAIFTTVGRIRELCEGDGGSGGGKDAVIAPVQYIDFENHAMTESDFDFPAYYKRSRFADEHELRFMVRYRIGNMHGGYGVYGARWPSGEYRPVDLHHFVTRIAIAPQSRPGYERVVTALLERNHIDIPVAWSRFPRIDRR